MPNLLLAVALLVTLAGCTGVDGPSGAAPAAQRPAGEGGPPTASPSPTPTSSPSPSRIPAAGEPAEESVPPPGVSDAAVQPGEPALLAVGDSLAAGTGLARPREGFVWRVHRALADAHGGELGLANLAVPGATSRSVLEGGQLAEAEGVLAARRVATVLVSVGGNDLLGLFAGPCGRGLGTPDCAAAIDAAVAAYAERLDATVGRLRAAAPEAGIVVLQLYNPFDLGMGSQPEQVAAEATIALNDAAAQVAGRHGARTADGYAALQGRITATTGMGASQPDVHPTARGHGLLAAAVLEALRP